MFAVYNGLLLVVFVLAFPAIGLFILFDFHQFRRRFYWSEPQAVDSRPSIVLHGASLGEINVIKKLLPELKKKYPGTPLIVSCATLTGFLNISGEMAAVISHAVFLPLEWPWSVRRMLRRTRPKTVIVVETELWPNFLREAKRSGARVVLLNGRLSDRSFPKYKAFRFFFNRVLQCFDAIGAQNREYFHRFLQMGAPESILSVTGNIKESIPVHASDPAAAGALGRRLMLPAGAAVFVAASTRPGEEEIVCDAFVKAKAKVPALALVVAPRHPKRWEEVSEILKSHGLAFNRRTTLSNAASVREVLLLDTLGELSGLFSLASAAFVGGTLKPFGGHNLLEPLSYLVPVSFGPSFAAQKESARLLLENGCGCLVKDAAELSEFIAGAAGNAALAKTYRANIQTFLETSDVRLKANLDLI